MFDETDMILEAKHVTRRFPVSGGRELMACQDINLKFYRGKTLGLIGESGCGKSTFMRFLVRLDVPTEGQILFKGKDLTKLKGENCGRPGSISRWYSRTREALLTRR